MTPALAGPMQALGNLVSVRRRWLAALAGIVAGAGVLTLSLGDTLIAHQQPALAARLPGNASLAASALLPPALGRAADAETRAIARRALLNSPIAGDALLFLALDARRQGNEARFAALLTLAGMAGWHDEVAQRQLFNAAVRQGNGPQAMRHADALLRQGRAMTELFAQFDRGLENPRFRAAARAYFARSQGWPAAYLASRGGALGDIALADLLATRAKSHGPLGREIAAPLLGSLLRQGRDAMAARIWAQTGGSDGRGSGPLPWPVPGAAPPATAFDWRLGDAYGIGIEDSGMLAATMPGAPPLSRLLALPPGRYRLATDSEIEELTGWNWALACGSRELVPILPLADGARFEVSADCPVQRLSLAPRGEAAQGGAQLRVLRVERLP